MMWHTLITVTSIHWLLFNSIRNYASHWKGTIILLNSNCLKLFMNLWMVHWNIDSIWRYPILNGMIEQNSEFDTISVLFEYNTYQLYNPVEHFNKISKFCFRLTTIIFSTIKVWPREHHCLVHWIRNLHIINWCSSRNQFCRGFLVLMVTGHNMNHIIKFIKYDAFGIPYKGSVFN